MNALRSEMPFHVMPSPSSGADPDELVECAGERRLVIESRLSRDVDQRHAALAHRLFGVVNAMLNQPYAVISYKFEVPSMDTLEQQFLSVPTRSLRRLTLSRLTAEVAQLTLSD